MYYKNHILITVIITLFAFSMVTAAQFTKLPNVTEYLNELNKKTNTRNPVNLKDNDLLGPKEKSVRPVGFEIVKKEQDAVEIARISKIVGPSFNVKYNSNYGSYYSNVKEAKQIPLLNTDHESMNNLKMKADKLISKLLGKDSSNYYFFNSEIDSIKFVSDPIAKLLRIHYRYVRKLNGRFVVDNSSFARITFSGNAELKDFEIVNPDLKPLQILKLVKFDATEKRLQDYAANAKKVEKSDHNGNIKMVAVKEIVAKKGFDTYFSKDVGDKKILVPHISMLVDNNLEDEDSYWGLINLSLDASTTSNLEKDMIEDNFR
jgi:hypothetical protein